jgi:hypothetical protein
VEKRATCSITKKQVTPTTNYVVKDTTTFKAVYKAAQIETDDSQTIKEALNRLDASYWKAAIISEYRSLARKKT